MFLIRPKDYLKAPAPKMSKPTLTPESLKEIQKIKVRFGTNFALGTLNMRRSTKLASTNIRSHQSLKIGLLPLDDIQGTGAQRLSTMVKQAKMLAKINVKFSGIITRYARKMFTSFKGKRNLKKLALDLNDASGFNARCAQSLSHGLRGLHSLSVLHIDFWQFITNQSLINFSLALKKMYSLSTLVLDLNKPSDLESFAVGIFFSNMKRLSSLSVLHLDFHNNFRTTNTDIQVLSSSVSQLASLTSVSLNFDNNTQITSNAIESLCLGLINRQTRRNAKELKSLKLSFLNCRELCNRGLIALSGYLEKAMEIEAIQLNFSRCKKITHKGVEVLAKSLGSSSLLSSLDLRFNECNRIRNNGLVELGSIVKNINSSCFINLEFIECCKVSEEMRKDLLMNFKGKKNAWLDGKKITFSC